MTEVGPARLGKHSKRQRVTGMTAPGVATPSQTVPASEENQVSGEFVSRLPPNDSPPPIDTFHTRGRAITMLIHTPLAFDSITIPLVAEVATLQDYFVHFEEETVPAFPLWVPNGVQITPHAASILSTHFPPLVYGPSFKWEVQPEFILRFAPEGGPYEVPKGVVPSEPYPRSLTQEQGEFVRRGGPGFEPFGLDSVDLHLPPGQTIPVASWTRSPWLADGLMVGEGNCTPSIGASERATVEAWEKAHGPVTPAEIAAINAFHRTLLEATANDGYKLFIAEAGLEALTEERNANACFKNPFSPECTPEVNERLIKIEEERIEAQIQEKAITLEQHALDGKPYRLERGPWVNGVEKWGYRMDLHKPILFPGVDFTKAHGTLILEIRPSNHPFDGQFQAFNEVQLAILEAATGKPARGLVSSAEAGRFLAGVATTTGWLYDWPSWPGSGFTGPLGNGNGLVSGPPYLTKGHGSKELSTVTPGPVVLGHVHS